ncbi:MAG: lytic transglycosylase domain-containing protein [Candidatus Sericytochromatia bacterium]
MNLLKRYCLAFSLLLGLSACDVEVPSLANLPGSGGSATALRLPANKISQSESVKMARQQAQRFGVETALVLGVITQESGFNANAVSPVGAMGLMQLMPTTVSHISSSSPVAIASAYNPGQNVAAGTWYLRSLYNQFKGFPEERRWQFALASYNGGIGRVGQAITKVSQLKHKPRTQVTWAEISSYLPAETRNYVPAVISHAAYYRTQLAKLAVKKPVAAKQPKRPVAKSPRLSGRKV